MHNYLLEKMHFASQLLPEFTFLKNQSAAHLHFPFNFYYQEICLSQMCLYQNRAVFSCRRKHTNTHWYILVPADLLLFLKNSINICAVRNKEACGLIFPFLVRKDFIMKSYFTSGLCGGLIVLPFFSWRRWHRLKECVLALCVCASILVSLCASMAVGSAA